MSPEQLEGAAIDPRSDIFSLGVVLYEMVAGRKAFDGPSRAAVTAAVLTREVPPAVDRAALGVSRARSCHTKVPDQGSRRTLAECQRPGE